MTVSGPIEDEQLVLDEHGFGDYGTGAARTDESGERRQQMEKEDGQIAHGTIVARSPHPRFAHDLAIRHAHVRAEETCRLRIVRPPEGPDSSSS